MSPVCKKQQILIQFYLNCTKSQQTVASRCFILTIIWYNIMFYNCYNIVSVTMSLIIPTVPGLTSLALLDKQTIFNLVYKHSHFELPQPKTVCTTSMFCMPYRCIFVLDKLLLPSDSDKYHIFNPSDDFAAVSLAFNIILASWFDDVHVAVAKVSMAGRLWFSDRVVAVNPVQ